MAKNIRKVSFNQVVQTIDQTSAHDSVKTKEQLKPLWYSREELVKSCAEAKSIIKIITAVNGDFKAIDHSQVCVVGLEKFHGKKERDQCRKLLVKSVLIRQEMNRGLGIEDEAHSHSLCEISEMISASFKEFALWQAAMHRFHACESSSSPSPLSTSLSPSGGSSPQPEPHQNEQEHLAKRQKVTNGYVPKPNTEGQSLSSSVENSRGLSRSTSQKLMVEMQHFVEGYCSR